ncbi:TniB family NTP-binding protein [Ruegeria atlantica]|uniref:TniB family NTP-binding protein n=1 Tax=Ruegeria atlantica TaxID=81569 RepID=UPI00147CC0ED
MTSKFDPSLLDIRIRHRAYQDSFDEMLSAVELARHQTGAIIPLLGPTRCGKTDLLHDLQDALKRTTQGPGKTVPSPNFGLETIPAKPNDLDLYRTMLRSFGYSYGPRERIGDLRTRLIQNVRDEGLEIIALDECNHCAETGANLSARATGDHFKRLIDDAGVILILAGLPKFQKIIDENEQFRERSLKTVHILPYSWSGEDDRMAYSEAVFGIFDLLGQCDVKIDFDDEEMAVRLYGLSGGRVGQVLRILKGASAIMKDDVMTFQDVVRAARQLVQVQAMPEWFLQPELPTDTQLAKSYVAVMHEAGLPVEPNTVGDLEAVGATG